MKFNNPLVPNYLIEDSGEIFKLKIITIPPWNLWTTATLNVPTGLPSTSKLYFISGWVIDDTDSTQIQIPDYRTTNNILDLYFVYDTGANIELRRNYIDSSYEYWWISEVKDRGELLIAYH